MIPNMPGRIVLDLVCDYESSLRKTAIVTQVDIGSTREDNACCTRGKTRSQAVRESASLKSNVQPGITEASLIEDIRRKSSGIVHCDFLNARRNIHEVSGSERRSTGKRDVGIYLLLEQIPPKQSILLRNLIVNPSTGLMVIEDTGDISDHSTKLDGHAQNGNIMDAVKSYRALFHREWSDIRQRSYSGISGERRLQLFQSVRCWS